MGANTTNAVYFLVTTLFDIVIWLFLLRIVLQWVRADFYNPISQLIWKATRYPTDWMRRFVPNAGNVNVSAALVVMAITLFYVHLVDGLFNLRFGELTLVISALLKLFAVIVNLYTFTIFVQAILSWLGPGVNNPASNILWSMNEPLLRPARRILPPLSGLDLSPLIVILLLQVLNRLLPLPGVFR